MRGSGRRRLGVVATLSLMLHALVLGWLAWPRPSGFVAAGPDLPLMSAELVSPLVASRPATTKPTARLPIQTHAEALPAPAVAPQAAVPAPIAAAPAGPAGPSEGLRAALRATAGCTRARTLEEREACEEKLGRMSPSTPRYGLHMDPGKRAYYDELAAAGPSGRGYGDDQPAGVTPGGAAYFRGVNCSIKFGVGKKPKGRQGELRLGRTPCSIPLQGSFFTPEASIHKR